MTKEEEEFLLSLGFSRRYYDDQIRFDLTSPITDYTARLIPKNNDVWAHSTVENYKYGIMNYRKHLDQCLVFAVFCNAVIDLGGKTAKICRYYDPTLRGIRYSLDDLVIEGDLYVVPSGKETPELEGLIVGIWQGESECYLHDWIEDNLHIFEKIGKYTR